MATDKRMTIAFLASDQNGSKDEPDTLASGGHKLSSLSTQSPPTQDDRDDLICSRNDSHQGITGPPARTPHARHHQKQQPNTTKSIKPDASEIEEELDFLPTSPSTHLSPGTSSPTAPNDPNPFHRQPRSPRPTYSEEQRFFVMYARIIQDKSWPDIEEDFATIFKQRSKGGLCSLYYRIRRSWGLEDVLKSGSAYLPAERQAVAERAGRFSREFLTSIGYLRS